MPNELVANYQLEYKLLPAWLAAYNLSSQVDVLPSKPGTVSTAIIKRIE